MFKTCLNVLIVTPYPKTLSCSESVCQYRNYMYLFYMDWTT